MSFWEMKTRLSCRDTRTGGGGDSGSQMGGIGKWDWEEGIEAIRWEGEEGMFWIRCKRRMRIERRNFVCLIRTARETKGIGGEREGQWDSDGRDREMGVGGGDLSYEMGRRGRNVLDKM